MDEIARLNALVTSYEKEAQKHFEHASRLAKWHAESQRQLQDCSSALAGVRGDLAQVRSSVIRECANIVHDAARKFEENSKYDYDSHGIGMSIWEALMKHR